jgi:predicted XRE-type DNA-binding protein
MSSARIIVGALHRVQRGHRKGVSDIAPSGAIRRPARAAFMLATAHMIREAIRTGQLLDQAEAARRLEVNRARVSQLLDLTLLAPDVQEHILFLEAVDGRQPLYERELRPVVRHRDWPTQRALFDVILVGVAPRDV